MEMTCPLTLTTTPTQTGLPARTCGQLIAGAVCVWGGGGGTRLSHRLGEGGWAVIYPPTPLSPDSAAPKSAPPLTLTHVASAAFVLMSFGLMSHSG